MRTADCSASDRIGIPMIDERAGRYTGLGKQNNATRAEDRARSVSPGLAVLGKPHVPSTLGGLCRG